MSGRLGIDIHCRHLTDLLPFKTVYTIANFKMIKPFKFNFEICDGNNVFLW